MKREFWEKRWEDGQIGFHQNSVGPLLERYIAMLPPSPSCILVPMCGKSLDLIYLAGRGHRVIGVELSPLAIKAFFEEHQLEFSITTEGDFEIYRAVRDDLDLTIYCGDFFDLDVSHFARIDGVWDRASLVALPTELRERYVASLAEHLLANTPYLLVAIEYDIQGKDGPPFCLNISTLKALFANTFRIKRIDPAVAIEPDKNGYAEVPYILNRI